VLLTASVRPLPPTAHSLRPRRGRTRLVAVLAVATAVAGVLAVARPARADAAGSLVGLTNQARAAAGLPGLATSGDLAAVASRQAANMAQSNVLSHTPGLASAVCCWVNVGENVGYGASASSIHAAFMASAAHRANILSRSYTQFGVGYATDSRGTLWVSEVFRRPKTATVTAPAPVVVSHAQPPATPRRVVVPPVAAPAATHAAAPPVRPAVVARAASRDLSRPPIDEAQRFAALFAARGAVSGTNPVSRLLDFAAKAASAG
jgi:uncharacterized protein YkwD